MSFEDLSLSLDIDSNFYSIEKNANTSESITVLEGYRKARNQAYTVQSVATWSENRGLEIPQPEKYERRSNLSGVSLDVAALAGEVSGLHQKIISTNRAVLIIKWFSEQTIQSGQRE